MADRIYYDLTLKNFIDRTSPDNITPLVFDEQRDMDLIPRADEYKLAIIRAQIDTFNLPVLGIEIEPSPNNDSNKCIYTITLEYVVGNVPVFNSGAINVIWIPQDKTIPVPSAPSVNSSGFQIFNSYYNCYDYEYFLTLINNCFVDCMDELIKLGAPATWQPCFMKWNPDLLTASLIGREDIFRDNKSTRCNIYFNRSLYALFSSLPLLKKNAITTSDNRIYQMAMNPFFGGHIIDNGGPYSDYFGTHKLIESKQLLSTIANWTPIASIVFCSNTLPVQNNFMSIPRMYRDNNLIQLSNTFNNYNSMITDITTDETSFKPNLLFQPLIIRYIDLIGSSSIRNIQVSVHILYKNGSLQPFYTSAGSSATLKLMFEKK